MNYIFADKLYIEDYIPARTEHVFMCVALWGAEQDTQPSSTPFPAPGCAGRSSCRTWTWHWSHWKHVPDDVGSWRCWQVMVVTLILCLKVSSTRGCFLATQSSPSVLISLLFCSSSDGAGKDGPGETLLLSTTTSGCVEVRVRIFSQTTRDSTREVQVGY